MPKRSEKTEPAIPLRLLAANDLGQVVVVEAADVKFPETAEVVARWGQPDRAKQAAECLAVSSPAWSSEAGTTVLAIGRISGRTELLDAHTGVTTGHLAAVTGSTPSNTGVRGLSFLWDVAEAPALLSCTAGGVVRIHAAQPVCCAAEPRDSGDAGPSCEGALLASWEVSKDVLCMSMDAAERHLAVGAKGSELGVWDLSTQQRIYLGKGTKPNRIDLVDPAHNSAVAYLPGKDSNRVLVGTGKHRLRLYDIRAHRRPALDLDFGTSRIVSLAVDPSGQRAWAGDTSGAVEVLDLRAARLAGAVKGLTGSARALACHPTLPLLAVVSLDRFLRIYDTESRKLLCKVFLKQPPTGVVFCPPRLSDPAEPERAQSASTPARRKRKQAVP